jgi:endonuclease/exonuclease/phosphatase family metal-dependent hydrolase
VTVTLVRLVSYNVHGLRDDRAALIAVLRGLAPDVVILQEAPRRLRWRARCAGLAHDVGLVVAAGGLPALGNLLLTSLRVRVHDTWCLRLPHTPGRHLRGAAFARCSIGSTRFVVAGSHLSTAAGTRPREAAVLKAALSAVDDPVILGADLNESAAGVAWRTLADRLTDAGAGGDVPTFSCANPRGRIDALFVDPRIEVLRYEVVDTPEARRASDHFPLLAELDVRA